VGTTPHAPGQGRLRTWPTADPDQTASGPPTGDSSCGRWGSRAWGRALAACASEPGGGGPGAGQEATGQAPATTFTEPRSKLSGDLKILLWSHFVSGHDEWFAPFAHDWGKKVGVNVTAGPIDNAQIPTRIAAEIQAGQGHDLIQYIAPLSQFEPSVNDLKDVTDEATSRWGQQLELPKQSSFNPATGVYYAYSPGWVPDPGDYRTSLWTAVGLPKRAQHLGRAARGASARDELKRFQERVGTTTIYVTHDQAEAMGLGDRIAVMDHGRVRQLGRPVPTELIRGDVFFWQSLQAAAILVAVPIAFVFNLFLDRFISGFTMGAVKG
jgi:hypothetical protein